jgi:hypothetical protein
VAYREDDASALERRQQLAREIASERLDSDARARAEDAVRAIDAARIDAARVRLPQVARAKIASPCSEAWDTMLGEGAVRSCSRCEKEVFDLSQMTLGQAEALVAQRGGDLCVRLYQRRDGTMMFADCAVGARGVVRRHATLAGAAMVVGGAALAWASQPAPVAQAAIPTAASSAAARAASERFLHAAAPIDLAHFDDDATAHLEDVLRGQFEYVGGSISVPLEERSVSVVVGAPVALEPSELDDSVLRRALRARRFATVHVYEIARGSDDGLEGRITVRFTVEPTGALSHVYVTRDFAGAAELGSSIAAQIRSIRLPSGPERPVMYEVPVLLTAR